MPDVTLDNRALVSIQGADAEHFLQNLITTDLASLSPGLLKPGALLTPQGKILFDFLISRAGNDHFLLDCMGASAPDFLTRLRLYRLRAKIDISFENQITAHVFWSDDSVISTPDQALRDVRFRNISVWRSYSGESGTDPVDVWTRLRIEHGIAEAGMDYQEGEAFPFDAGLDQTEGLAFRKGCYVGQEVISRMYHRGTARRRIFKVSSECPLPGRGTQITAGGKPVGHLGSVCESAGLAMARLDRVKNAMDSGISLLAETVPVRLEIPPDVSYRFPDSKEDSLNDA